MRRSTLLGVQMDDNWPSPTVQTLPDQVAVAILQRIATGQLQPGNRLPSQRDLAQTMGVGLAVIREAIQRLAALNVVEASHGSGTVVRPFRWIPLIYDSGLFALAMQRIGIRDLWEARRLIESQIIRLAAERASAADIAAMRAIVARASPLPLVYASSQALNREFHLALARAAKNAVLEDLLAPLLDIRSEGADHRFTPETCRRTWEAHEAIIRAVETRDPEAAERVMLAHFAIGPILLAEVEAVGARTSAASPGRRATRARSRVRRPAV
jgi:GntR family transcriptional regulator, transcriptional repressor for pyruvate dehydrogenase complex